MLAQLVDPNHLAQISAAFVAGLLVLIPLAFLWARSWASARISQQQAAAAKAELELLETQAKLAAQRRLSDALVTQIEKDTRPLSEEEAKKTKGAFRAVAALAGADDVLKEAVERLGFAKSKTSPAVQAPSEEDVK